MNITILNGAEGNGLGATLRSVASAIAAEAGARGWTASAFDLASMDMKPCRGCFACWLKHPGKCAIKDNEEVLLKALATTDLAVWLTPVVYGGYGPVLKKALDRVIPILLPFFVKVEGELHHPQRYPRRRSLIVIGTQAASDEEAERIFHGLVQRNALNLNSVRTASRVIREGAAPTEWATDLTTLLAEAEEAVA